MGVNIGPAATVGDVRNSTHYARTGISYDERRHIFPTLGELRETQVVIDFIVC